MLGNLTSLKSNFCAVRKNQVNNMNYVNKLMQRIILKNHLSPARTANWRNMGNTSITLNWRGELDHTLLRRSPKPIWRYITTTQHWRNMTGTPAVLKTKQRNRPFQTYWSLLCASLSKRVFCKNEFDKIWMKINQHAERIFIWKVLHKFKTQSIVLTQRQKGNSEVTYWQKIESSAGDTKARS